MPTSKLYCVVYEGCHARVIWERLFGVCLLEIIGHDLPCRFGMFDMIEFCEVPSFVTFGMLQGNVCAEVERGCSNDREEEREEKQLLPGRSAKEAYGRHRELGVVKASVAQDRTASRILDCEKHFHV